MFPSDSDTLDEDELLAELEAEIENDEGPLREQGLKELQREMERIKQMRESMHGKYAEMTDEKEVIRTSASEPLCVIHFYHSNFRRCAIMDKHLGALAPKYFNTRFLRVFVENVPFLIEKLSIKVLPCVICFINGVSKDSRIIGFEELGNVDGFSTATLELRLLHTGVIQKDPQFKPVVKHAQAAVSHGTRLRQNHYNDDDEDFDL
ncbi:thioredoxin-like protein [Multifurca ochricompacta]|uniref:Thioredoxin-like protein n=1 Tax=Multifurca ochricompacta TaxID=376703 RepID=A0AAD4MBE3_9AGAM|nr:thioredoxin-like protein [Multifurca ochricompacta]